MCGLHLPCSFKFCWPTRHTPTLKAHHCQSHLPNLTNTSTWEHILWKRVLHHHSLSSSESWNGVQKFSAPLKRPASPHHFSLCQFNRTLRPSNLPHVDLLKYFGLNIFLSVLFFFFASFNLVVLWQRKHLALFLRQGTVFSAYFVFQHWEHSVATCAAPANFHYFCATQLALLCISTWLQLPSSRHVITA